MTRVDLVQQRLHQVRLGVAQIVKDGLGLPPYPACRHLIAGGAVLPTPRSTLARW
jgi:hypothetical protein